MDNVRKGFVKEVTFELAIDVWGLFICMEVRGILCDGERRAKVKFHIGFL